MNETDDDLHNIKQGDWVVTSSGGLVQAERNFSRQFVDSVWENKEVAEIRAGVVKAEQGNQLLTAEAIAKHSLKVLKDELAKSHLMNHKEYLEELSK